MPWVDVEDVGLNLHFLDIVPNKAMTECEAPNLLIKRDSSNNCKVIISKGDGSTSLHKLLRKEIAQLKCLSSNPLIKRYTSI